MVNGSTHAIKKHDRDHDVQARVRDFKNAERYEDWTSCEMYGHKFDEGICACGEHQDETP